MRPGGVSAGPSRRPAAPADGGGHAEKRGPWQASLDACLAWGAGLLRGSGPPSAEGAYPAAAPTRRTLRQAFGLLILLLWLAFVWWRPVAGHPARRRLRRLRHHLAAGAAVPLHRGHPHRLGRLGLTLRHRLGRPVRIPWSEVRRGPRWCCRPTPISTSPWPYAATVRIVAASRAPEIPLLLDEEGRDFLTVLAQHTTLVEGDR